MSEEQTAVRQRDVISESYKPLLAQGMPREQYDELVDLTDHAVNEAVKALDRVTGSSTNFFVVLQATIGAAAIASERLAWISKTGKETAEAMFNGASEEEARELIKPIGSDQ